MKNKKNRKLALAVLSCSTAAVLLAGGTFAWYAVSNTATASVGGQAVKAQDMRVGLKTDVAVEHLETIDGYTGVQWMPAADEGSADATKAQDYFNTALNTVVGGRKRIKPISSKAYDETADFNLYVSPTDETPDPTELAPAADYIEYTITFLTQEGNQPIFFNRTQMNFGGISSSSDTPESQLLQTLRVAVSGSTDGTTYSQPTIFKPASLIDGTTDVGGALDLNGDGVYDYEVVTSPRLDPETGEVNGSTSVFTEVYYGEYDGEVGYELVPEEEKVTPVPNSNKNSFVAAHVGAQEGFYGGDTEMVANTVAKTQMWHGMDYYTYYAEENPDLGMENHPIVTTNADGYAEINIKIWVEGWDTACTNDIENLTFDATLAFVSPHYLVVDNNTDAGTDAGEGEGA